MSLVEVRKFATMIEEVFHEGGPPAARPLKQGACLAVIRNPYAGRYVPDILPLMKDLEPLGLEMARRLVAALGVAPAAIEAYGKGAIVGSAGELSGTSWFMADPAPSTAHRQSRRPGRGGMRGRMWYPNRWRS